MAAVVGGLRTVRSGVPLKGVILNRVAGARHENILRQKHRGPLRRARAGRRSQAEQTEFSRTSHGAGSDTGTCLGHGESIAAIAAIVENHVDMAALIDIANRAPVLQPLEPSMTSRHHRSRPDCGSRSIGARIGIIRDSAFQFYYPENIEALSSAGAKIIFFSPVATDIHSDRSMPFTSAVVFRKPTPRPWRKMCASGRKLKHWPKPVFRFMPSAAV